MALAAPALPFLSQTAEMLERAVTRPATPVYPRVSAQLQAMLEAVLTGRLGPARAARRTTELIAAITGLPVAEAPEGAHDRAGDGRAAAASADGSRAERPGHLVADDVGVV